MALFDCFKPKAAPVGAERPDISKPAQKLLRCPWAKHWEKDMPTSGTYRKGYPEGAIVHFTEGSTIESSISWGAKQGYAFWGIGRDGTVYQTHALNRYGAHAGESQWPGLGSSVSKYLVGIEVAAAGRVERVGEKYKAYFHRSPAEYFDADRVRVIPQSVDQQILAGAYHKFSPEQEESLIRTLLWMKENNPEVFSFDYVLGHDEVSGPKGIGRWRKNDPGGALSMPMKEFRALLKRRWEQP